MADSAWSVSAGSPPGAGARALLERVLDCLHHRAVCFVRRVRRKLAGPHYNLSATMSLSTRGTTNPHQKSTCPSCGTNVVT